MPYGYDHPNKKWRPARLTRHGAQFVENHKIGWLEGRQFKTFIDLSLNTGATYLVKIECPVEFVVSIFDLDITDGELEMRTLHGGEVTGTSSLAALPVICTNDSILERQSPFYEPQMVINKMVGGTHTGGTVIDLMRLKTSNATAQSSSVGRTNVDVMFKSAGVCYIKFTAISACKAIFKMTWEERLATPPQ